MIKKTIPFEDFNGNKLTEDFYFNLSKADIAEMELSEKGGLTAYLQKIVAEEDGKKLVAIFKDLLTRSVGKRSEDGRRFIKNQDIIDDFVQTNAYSELFMELSTNAEQAAAFVNGVVPSSLQEAVKNNSVTNVELPTSNSSAEPAWLTEGRTPTPAEVRDATPEQLQMAFQRKQASSAEITPPLA